MTAALPATDQEWLKDIALAYRDAATDRLGLFSKGRPMQVGGYFHLAPLVCIKLRRITATAAKRDRVVEGVLASYVATTSRTEGGEHLKKSPLLAFAFCYLAAHFVLD